MNRVVFETNEILSEEEIDRILSFGEETNEINLSEDEIEKKIEEVLKTDSAINNDNNETNQTEAEEDVEILDKTFEDSEENEDEEPFGF